MKTTRSGRGPPSKSSAPPGCRVEELLETSHDRTRIDGIEGTRIWTGHGVLAHNLVKISALAG
jgi:hypothetical protein